MASGHDLGFELEDLDQVLNSVIFEDIQDNYQPQQDIFLIYSVKETFKPSSRDWIGLYHQNWESPRSYITFEWAQKQARSENSKDLRSVLFQSKYINLVPSDKEYYQFLYVTKHSEIAGVSKKFRLCNYCPLDDETSAFVCFERPLDDGIGSLTFVERNTTKPKGLLESFELVKSFSEPKVLETKPFKRYTDKVTLTSSFAEPKSHLDTTIDPVLKEYLLNKEKALVPISNRSIVPYGSYKPIFTLCNKGKDTGVNIEELLIPIATSIFTSNEKIRRVKRKVSSKFSIGNESPKSSNQSLQCASRGSFPFNTTSGKGITVRQKPCAECKKKRQEMKTLKDKLSRMREEGSKIEKELDSKQQALDMKEMLLGDLSSQVKNLVQDNGHLTAVNDSLYNEKHRLKVMTKKNSRIALNNSKVGKKLEKLTEENKRLEEEIAKLENLKNNTDFENSKLTSKNQYLEQELQLLKGQQAELEQYLDDIMYTLSLQGYSKLVGPKGNVTDLTKKKGSVLELHGWSMQNSRRTERHLATIGHQEATIAELHGECEKLRLMVRQAEDTKETVEKQYKDEQDRGTYLQNEVEDIREKLRTSEEKQASLSRLLIKEKRQKLDMIKQYQESEKALKNRVKSLTSALKLSAKKTTTCDSATQAAQPSATYATQTDTSKSYAMSGGATGALHSVCDYVTSSMISARKALEKNPSPCTAKDTVRGHASRWSKNTAPGSPATVTEDPAALMWSDLVDQEPMAFPTPSQESFTSFDASFTKPKASDSGMRKAKKVKVFGGKVKKPRKFMFKAYTLGKAKPVSTDYTPFLYGSKPKASD